MLVPFNEPEYYFERYISFSILVCEIDEFACRNGENCVPIDVVCNGENDCEDMSDESTILCGE